MKANTDSLSLPAAAKGRLHDECARKVKFTSNKLTDTFYYYGRLSIKSDKVEADVNLQRAVAAFKLHITDETIPEEVRSIKFYYTGGEQYAGCNHGIWLCKQSADGNLQFHRQQQRLHHLYTFPHEENKAIKMTVSILDDDAHAIKTFTKSGFKMKRNEIIKTDISLTKSSGGSLDEDDDRNVGLTVDTTCSRNRCTFLRKGKK